MPKGPNALYVGIALFATWVIWGSTYLGIKIALPALPPFLQMGSRFVAAGAVLLLIEWWRGGRMPSPAEWRSGLIIGTLLLGGGAGGTAFAEQTVASGLAAAFVASEPAMILLINTAFGKRPRKSEVVGIALGLIGVIILISGSGFSASPVGLIAMAVASLSWSLGSVLSTGAVPSAPGAMGAASQMLCGGLSLLAVSWLTHEGVPRWPIPFEAAAAWLYLVVFGSLFAFTAFTFLLQHVRTSIAMSYTFVNPLVALGLGAWLEGEHFTGKEILATLIIVAGVVLVSRTQEHS